MKRWRPDRAGYLFLKLKFPSSDCARVRKKNTLCISEFLKNIAYFETDEVYNRIADNYWLTLGTYVFIVIFILIYIHVYQEASLAPILSLWNLQRRRYRYWLEMISISIPSFVLNCLLRFALLRDLPFITIESYVLLGIRIPDSGQVWFILGLFHSLFSSIVI